MSFLNIGQRFEKVMGKEPELLDAARTGNLQTVEKLLSSKSRKSHVGGAFGHKLTSLLKSVNINYTDKNGYTALHHAALNGHRDIVELLLKSGAQPGLLDNKDCSPVHLAAWNGDAEIVMQLLMAGIDSDDVSPVNVNQQNSSGDTALHSAAQYGHVAVVDVLLQKSANPTIRNLNEESPLDLAAQYGRLEVVQRLLISHPELAHHPSSTQSPLHLASRNGHRDIVAVLLDNNFDIQTTTETGNALHEAALHGKLDVVKLLLERGIDVNQRDSKGQTVLELLNAHQAQQKSFTVIMRAIQDHMRESGQPGLYESLAGCRSGVDKPTAAVKPLPPAEPHPQDVPCPPDKVPQTPPTSAVAPHLPEDQSADEDKPQLTENAIPIGHITVENEPHPFAQSAIPEDTLDRNNKQMVSESPERVSVVPVGRDIPHDRVVSHISSPPRGPPPPLPPRASMVPADDKRPPTQILGDPQMSVVPEKSSPKSLVPPKKPPRQKKSPAPARKSPPQSQNLDIPNKDLAAPVVTASASVSPIPATVSAQQNDSTISQTVDTDSDSVKIESSQHSLPMFDQSQNSFQMDQLDTSLHSSSSRKSTGFVVSDSDKKDAYIDMSSVSQTRPSSKPISEVKPQIKETPKSTEIKDAELKPVQTIGDAYDILFPNLKKNVTKGLIRPELCRANTEPLPDTSEYVTPYPAEPSEKSKEKQGLLRRINTAPNESSLLSMQYIEAKEQSNEPQDEHYSETVEKRSASLSSPKENVYATIADEFLEENKTQESSCDQEEESTFPGESTVLGNKDLKGESTDGYSQIQDLSPDEPPKELTDSQPIEQKGV